MKRSFFTQDEVDRIDATGSTLYAAQYVSDGVAYEALASDPNPWAVAPVGIGVPGGVQVSGDLWIPTSAIQGENPPESGNYLFVGEGSPSTDAPDPEGELPFSGYGVKTLGFVKRVVGGSVLVSVQAQGPTLVLK